MHFSNLLKYLTSIQSHTLPAYTYIRRNIWVAQLCKVPIIITFSPFKTVSMEKLSAPMSETNAGLEESVEDNFLKQWVPYFEF